MPEPNTRLPQALTILLVEDDQDSAELMSETLGSILSPSFHVEWVDTLGKGLVRLQAGGIDAVLLDLSLPDSQSLDTYKTIQSSAPLVPIVIMTGMDDDQNLALEALHLGAQDYIVKGRPDANLLLRCIAFAIQRKRYKVALRESQEMYQLAIAGANEGIWDWKIESDQLFFSARFKTLLGFDESNFPNAFQSWSSKVHPADFERVMESLTLHLTEHMPFEVDYRLMKSDGAYYWFCSRGQALWNSDGTAVRMAGALQEITHRISAAENERKALLLEQREEFMATLTHDLKNPLIGADLVLNALITGKAGDLSLPQRKMLLQLQSSNRELVSLIQNVIGMYRFGQNPYAVSPAEINLVEVIDAAITSAQPLAEQRSIHLEREVARNFPNMQVDPVAIRRVLNNLIDNAIKFTPDGGAVSITLQQLDDSMLLEVRDTGSGIDVEELSKIFEPFFQCKNGRVRESGTGLGLHVCKQIVLAHRGTISCQSAQGAETVFSIKIPMTACPSPAPVLPGVS